MNNSPRCWTTSCFRKKGGEGGEEQSFQGDMKMNNEVVKLLEMFLYN